MDTYYQVKLRMEFMIKAHNVAARKRTNDKRLYLLSIRIFTRINESKTELIGTATLTLTIKKA